MILENQEKFLKCLEILANSNKAFGIIKDKLDTLEEWELDEIPRLINSIDFMKWNQIEKIMGKEDFKKFLIENWE
jgi:hypothetical protein